MRHRNLTVVEKALKEVLKNSPELLLPSFVQLGYMLLADATIKKEYRNYTGNTVTSLSVGIYLRGAIDTIISNHDSMKAPVRVKMKRGETSYLDPDYDGESRFVSGNVDTDGKYGYETAFDFLVDHKISSRIPIALVITTGTEYSEYLQDERDLNVLTNTELYARQLLSTNIQSIVR